MPLVAELNAEGWAIVIAAIFLGIAKIVEMVLAYKREKDKAERDRVMAAAVKQVAVTQADTVQETREQLSGMAEVGRKTHDLANSAMLEQKRMHAVKCRAMATKTNDPVDVAEADAAEQAYREHKEGQAKSDVKEVAELRDKAKRHDELKEAVEAVPEKTAALTVEKPEEKGGAP